MRKTTPLVALGLALLGCRGEPLPSEPAGCLRIDGAYAYSFTEARCGRSGASETRIVLVNQTDCDFNAVIPGYALLDGRISGNTVVFSLTYLVSGDSGCGNVHVSGAGTVSVSGGITITATYGSGASPPGGCPCLPAPGEGTLVLRS